MRHCSATCAKKLRMGGRRGPFSPFILHELELHDLIPGEKLWMSPKTVAVPPSDGDFPFQANLGVSLQKKCATKTHPGTFAAYEKSRVGISAMSLQRSP